VGWKIKSNFGIGRKNLVYDGDFIAAYLYSPVKNKKYVVHLPYYFIKTKTCIYVNKNQRHIVEKDCPQNHSLPPKYVEPIEKKKL
jgi:hypothetical protein